MGWIARTFRDSNGDPKKVLSALEEVYAGKLLNIDFGDIFAIKTSFDRVLKQLEKTEKERGELKTELARLKNKK